MIVLNYMILYWYKETIPLFMTGSASLHNFLASTLVYQSSSRSDNIQSIASNVKYTNAYLSNIAWANRIFASLISSDVDEIEA